MQPSRRGRLSLAAREPILLPACYYMYYYYRVEHTCTLTVWMSGRVSQVRWPMRTMGSARVMVGGTGPNAVPSSNRQVVMTPIFTSDSSSNLYVTKHIWSRNETICILNSAHPASTTEIRQENMPFVQELILCRCPVTKCCVLLWYRVSCM